MDPNIITLIAAIAALVVGIIAGKFIFAKDTRKRVEEAELQAQTLIKEAQLRAETVRKEKELEAKERFVQLKVDHEKEVLERNRKVVEGENRIRQKEQAISAALQEKDTLLRELYHRVKNNLQVISSLFSLQLRTLPDGEARLALQESADRVRAMALVHEKLYQSKNLSSIALDDYIGDLCHQLGNAAGAAERGIALEASAQPVEVGLQVAVPLGLVLNELLANSLRHGFPEGRRGHIAVHLACGADRALSLTVTDDGVGLPPGMNIAASRTLGLKLVQALASQLDGSFSLESRDGTVARLQFRLVGEKRQDAAPPRLVA